MSNNDDNKVTHFGYQQVPWQEKQQRVAGVFRSVAAKYDVMNDLISMGSHRVLKRMTLELAGVRPGQKVLDLAGGTGDLAIKFSRLVGDSGQVVLADINASMLQVGRSRLTDRGYAGNIEYVQADAEHLPFPDNNFNAVSIAFGLRNVTDKDQALRDMTRVLKPGGKLFVHIFCHRNLTYLFETEGESNWMGRYFFTGGMMPSYDWLPRCADRLSLEDRWAVNGTHYGKTLEAWLALADRKRQTLIPLLEECYGAGQGKLWLQRWRMFFMACAELFNYGDGEEWFVGHYLFRREE